MATDYDWMSKFYTPADFPTIEEIAKIPGKGGLIMARATGEFRQPRKGEWFLSGAVVEAYRASCDWDGDPYHIAKLVRAERIVTYREIT